MTLISMMWPPLICCLPDSLLDFSSGLLNQPLIAADVLALIEVWKKVFLWSQNFCRHFISATFNLIFSQLLASVCFLHFVLSAQRLRSDYSSCLFCFYSKYSTAKTCSVAFKRLPEAFQLNPEIPLSFLPSHKSYKFMCISWRRRCRLL